MPYPAIRCRNFDDEGNGNCRKGSECTFTHPNSSDWARARRNGRTPSSSSTRNPTRQPSNGWDSPAPDHGAAVTSTNATKLSETGKRWGAPVPADNNQASTSNAAWGASTHSDKPTVDYPGKKVEPVVWDIDAPSWGQASGGGWGSSGDEWRYSSGGGGKWGNTTDSGTSGSGVWGNDKQKEADKQSSPTIEPGTSTGGAWGEAKARGEGSDNKQKNNSVWGSTESNNKDDKGKGKQKEDIVMEGPSHPHTHRPQAHSSAQESSTKQLDNFFPLRVDDRASHPQPNSPSPSPVTPSLPNPKRTFAALPKRRPLSGADDLKKKALELSAKLAAKETGRIHIPGTPDTQSPVPPKYIGPKGRLNLFSDILIHMQDLVISHVHLERSQSDNARWKRTQASDIYGHATPLTRDILDLHGSEYRKKLQNAQKRQEDALVAVIRLPDFSSKAKVPDPSVTKDSVEKYTKELRSWIESLEIHKRLLLEKNGHRDTTSLAEPTTDETEPLQHTPLQRDNWTWKELKAATDRLESRIRDMEDEERFDEFIDMGAIEERVDSLASEHMEVDDEIEQSSTNLNGLLLGVTQVGDHITTQAVRAAELIEKLDNVQKEIDKVVAEKTKMNEILAMAETQFEEFKQIEQAQATQINELAEQVQALHLLQKPRSSSPSSPTAAPVEIDDIIDYIRPLVLKRMEVDMTPLFSALRQRCRENQDNVSSQLQERVNTVVAEKEAIQKRVMSMSISQVETPAAPSTMT